MAWTEDLDVFMDGLDAVSVSFTGSPVGLLGYEDFADVAQLSDEGRAEVIARQRTLLVRSDAVAGLRPGSAIVVNGVTRKVLNPKAQDDGAFTTLTLR